MLWFAIPAVILIGKVIYDAVTDEDQSPPSRQKSILELNFERLKNQISSQPGYKIAIIGQPGAGKSSLLKKMTDGEVVPLPVIGTQTDATDWSSDIGCNLLSIYKNYIFVDVPGYDTSSHPFHTFSSYFPFDYFDAFIFIIHGKLHSSDEDIFRLISRSGKKVCIAKSFADSLEINDFKTVENDMRTRLSLSDSTSILFFSNKTGEGIKSVFSSICR